MFDDLESGFGLDVVLALQEMESALLDALAQTLDFMGSDLFFLVVLPLVYWSINRRLGMRLLFALMIGGLVNVTLKEIFGTPRPFQVSDDVRMLTEASHYGFPSGHVMVALVVWGYAAVFLRQRWAAIAAAVYVVLMMWARMYAGVHYPQDVVGGVIFGAMLLWLFIQQADRIPPVWDALPTQAQIASVVLALILAGVFTLVDDTGAALLGVLMGVGGGAVFMSKTRFSFIPAETWQRRGLAFIAGIVGMLALFMGLRLIFGTIADDGTVLATLLRVLRYALVAVFAFTIYPLLATRMGLAQRVEPTFVHRPER